MQFGLEGDQGWSTRREVDGQSLGQLVGQDPGGNKHKPTAVPHCRLLPGKICKEEIQDNIGPLNSTLHMHTKDSILWFVQLLDNPCETANSWI